MIQRILYVGLITGFCILGDVTAQNTSNESNPVWGNWEKWGEQNDGTYRNPIIPADYSDIDCIQVGDDYYAISSTFQFSPGMTLLHSKDLVNWEFCGNIISDLTQIGDKLNWDHCLVLGTSARLSLVRYIQPVSALSTDEAGV